MDFIEISALGLSGIGCLYTLFLVFWLIFCHIGGDDNDKE